MLFQRFEQLDIWLLVCLDDEVAKSQQLHFEMCLKWLINTDIQRLQFVTVMRGQKVSIMTPFSFAKFCVSIVKRLS